MSLAFACGEDAVSAPATADAAPPDASPPDASETDAPAPSASGVEAFCKGTLGLYAPRYATCCDSNAAPKKYGFDETLLKALLPACTATLGKSVQGGRATFDPAAAATCEKNVGAAIQARACPDVLRSPSNQPSRSIFDDAPGCVEMIAGRQGAGAPCANDHECVDGLTCVGWTSDGDGTCKAPPGEGAPCGYAVPDGGGFIELVRWGFGTHPRCAAGLYCASTATQQGVCRATKPANGSCSAHDECASGLRCQLGVCGTEGPAPEGGPCKKASDCQDRLYCKAADGGSACAPREVAGTSCANELGSECQGACVQPDGGAAACVAYCGSQ